MASIKLDSFRSDVQGLRAIAVLFVVVYHIWGEWLPGGFVGVDVFFVISGFLITDHLRREMECSGTISLKSFYSRRVRRLLPAASVVLVFVAVATILLAPRFKWLEISQDIVASTLYVQNWRLLIQSIDYLGAEEAAGPLQHFWSLAIEEQYYIVWPLVLIAVAAVFPRRLFNKSMIFVAGFVIGISLLCSVLVTRTDQSIAYFATHTRIWELAIGSFLAFVSWGCVNRVARGVAGFIGLLMIVVSAFLFSADTAFPGYAALLPTLGAALVLWVGGKDLLHEKLLSLPPMKFLGDVSYSLYLWHWPLIVFAGYIFSDGHGLLGGLALFVLSIVLAWLSKRFVEDRFRQVATAKRSVASSINHNWQKSAGALAIACMGGTLLMSAGIFTWVTKQGNVAEYGTADAFPGAAVIYQGRSNTEWQYGTAVLPAPELAREDLPSSYSNGCHQSVRHVKPKGCDIGVMGGSQMVVLVGDSHAANWIPAFEELGLSKGWRVLSYTKSACSLTLRDITNKAKPYSECTQWSQAVLDELDILKPDLVVLGRSRGARLYGANTRNESNIQATIMLADVLRRIRSSGAQVAVMRDTPRMPFDPLMCFENKDKCRADKATAMAGEDPLINAAALDGFAKVIDMTSGLCVGEYCDVVIGDVLVWRDWHHLTESYSRTLAPFLAEQLGEISNAN